MGKSFAQYLADLESQSDVELDATKTNIPNDQWMKNALSKPKPKGVPLKINMVPKKQLTDTEIDLQDLDKQVAKDKMSPKIKAKLARKSHWNDPTHFAHSYRNQ